MTKTRICRGCEKEKPLNITHWYSKHSAPDGFETLCKVCTRSEVKRKQAAKAKPEKMCAACMKVYPLTTVHFYASRKNRDGFRRYCIPCEKQHDKEVRAGVKHARRDSGPRSSSKFCDACGGMPHRVEGSECRACGLAFEVEQLPPLQLRRA